MATIAENRKQYATSLAFDMLRGEDFHGMTAAQVTFLRGVISRAYPGVRSEGETSWKTIRWYDGTSEWALSWWSRTGGGGQLVNTTLSNARGNLSRMTELRKTKLEHLHKAVALLDGSGIQVIDTVKPVAEATRNEPSLRRQIIWGESLIATVEAQREQKAYWKDLRAYRN